MLRALRSGEWVTRQRIIVYSCIMLAVTLGCLVALGLGSNGLNDARGRPLGTDFSNVYAAGTYVLDDKAADAFDPALQYQREQKIFGEYTPFYGWCYPPFFLLIAAALALLPYLWAVIVWQGSTLALYLWMQRHILPGNLVLLAALAFPAVLVNFTHAHNGFLTATLLGVALVWLPTRPLLAGIAIGLLSYKPQFGLLIPLALLAGMHGRAFFSAAVTVIALCVVVTTLWGVDIWHAFIASMEFTRVPVLEEGGTGFQKIQTIFSWVRLWGGSVPLAYLAQGMVQLASIVLVWRLWRSKQSHEIKAAGLIVGCLLATPYMLDYDLMALAPAFAFWVRAGLRDGFAPYEKSFLALAWITPLVARMAAQHLLLPLGVWSLLALAWLLWRRVRLQRAG